MDTCHQTIHRDTCGGQVLGSFMLEVQQAPNLQLFNTGNQSGDGSGAASPLVRSVDDWGEQLDSLRVTFNKYLDEPPRGTFNEPASAMGEHGVTARHSGASPRPSAEPRLSPVLDEAPRGGEVPRGTLLDARGHVAGPSSSPAPISFIAQTTPPPTASPAASVRSKEVPVPIPRPPLVSEAERDSTERLLSSSPPPADSLFPMASAQPL